MTHLAKAPRLDEPNDGANDALRGSAVVCSQRLATIIASSIDALDGRLDGPLDDPPGTAVSLDGFDRAVAAASTPLLRRILSP